MANEQPPRPSVTSHRGLASVGVTGKPPVPFKHTNDAEAINAELDTSPAPQTQPNAAIGTGALKIN